MEIISGEGLAEYFRDDIKRLSLEHGLELSEMTEFYLVNLLSSFEKTENLFTMSDGRLEEEPLAVMLAKAISGDSASQIRQLKHLGDTALYISGFFPEHIERSLVDVDYYINMGSSAYASLSDCFIGDRTFSELYKELSDKFPSLTHLLSNVGNPENISSDIDLIKIYERWVKSGNEDLKSILIKSGLIPQKKISC